MRVLIVSQYFWPENFRINDVAKGLSESGHDVTIYTGIPNYPKGEFFPNYGLFSNRFQVRDGVKIIRVPVISRGDAGPIRLALNYLSFVAFGCLLVPVCLKGEFDVILCYQLSPVTVAIPALLIKWVKGAPLALWVQDLWPESLSATGAIKLEILISLVRKLVRFIYSHCDLVLTQSRAFFQPIRDMGVSQHKLIYMPNSAEDFYMPIELPDGAVEKTMMSDGFNVLFAGNIGVAQDFETIISTANLLQGEKDIKFVILGDGRARGDAEDKIKELGLQNKFLFLGRFPPEAMPAFFSVADALLVTLRKEPIFSFTIPSKVQSYLACAKPILAALDGEGAKVIEEAHAGFAVPAGAPELLAIAIKRMRDFGPEKRKALGISGRQYFEKNFEHSMLVGKLETALLGLSSA